LKTFGIILFTNKKGQQGRMDEGKNMISWQS